jgi:hypothetical protein
MSRALTVHAQIKELKSYPYEERCLYWERRAQQYALTPLPDLKATASLAHRPVHDHGSVVSESSLDTHARNQKVFEELLNTCKPVLLKYCPVIMFWRAVSDCTVWSVSNP